MGPERRTVSPCPARYPPVCPDGLGTGLPVHRAGGDGGAAEVVEVVGRPRSLPDGGSASPRACAWSPRTAHPDHVSACGPRQPAVGVQDRVTCHRSAPPARAGPEDAEPSSWMRCLSPCRAWARPFRASSRSSERAGSPVAGTSPRPRAPALPQGLAPTGLRGQAALWTASARPGARLTRCAGRTGGLLGGSEGTSGREDKVAAIAPAWPGTPSGAAAATDPVNSGDTPRLIAKCGNTAPISNLHII